MNLCCEVSPIRTCKTCLDKFCPEHVYTKENYSFSSAKLRTSECHLCYHSKVRWAELAKPRPGLTFKELYLELRKICPTGYLTVSVQIQDSLPGLSPVVTEWNLYHEKYLSFKGATPEQVLASFKAKLENEPDPQVSPLGNIDV